MQRIIIFVFFEVSAKTGLGINLLFDKVINGSMEKVFSVIEKDEGDDKVRLSSIFEKGYIKEKNRKCCL